MSRTRLILTVCLVFLIPLLAYTGERGPGKYSGVVLFDRWDACTLCSGPFVMYISETVKEQLRPYAGQCVQIHATKVRQDANPGDGLISEFKYLGPAPIGQRGWPYAPGGLSLRIESSASDLQPIRLSLAMTNSSLTDMHISGGSVAPTLLARKADRENVFVPSDGPSYALITRTSLGPMNARNSRLESHWADGDRLYSWVADPALPDSFPLQSGETRSVALEFRLPKGQYQFFVAYGGGVHATRSMTSNLISFDIDGAGKVTFIESAVK